MDSQPKPVELELQSDKNRLEAFADIALSSAEVVKSLESLRLGDIVIAKFSFLIDWRRPVQLPKVVSDLLLDGKSLDAIDLTLVHETSQPTAISLDFHYSNGLELTTSRLEGVGTETTQKDLIIKPDRNSQLSRPHTSYPVTDAEINTLIGSLISPDKSGSNSLARLFNFHDPQLFEVLTEDLKSIATSYSINAEYDLADQAANSPHASEIVSVSYSTCDSSADPSEHEIDTLQLVCRTGTGNRTISAYIDVADNFRMDFSQTLPHPEQDEPGKLGIDPPLKRTYELSPDSEDLAALQDAINRLVDTCNWPLDSINPYDITCDDAI